MGAVLERGRDLAAFDLVMAIVGPATAHAQRRDASRRIAPFAAQIPALAVEIDHRHAAMVVIVFVAAMVMPVLVAVVMAAAVQMVAMGVAALEAVVVAWQAIARSLARVGQAKVALRADPGQAQAARVRAVEAAAHAPLGLAVGRPAAAHAVVAGIARHALGVDGQLAGAARQRERARRLASAGAAAQLGRARDAVLGNGRGNLVVQDVDHAAHGTAAAVDQRRGAAQHFDLRGEHGLAGHGMVRADGGGIVQLGAIAEDLHARPVHAADDGPACACAEMAGHGCRARRPASRPAWRPGAA